MNRRLLKECRSNADSKVSGQWKKRLKFHTPYNFPYDFPFFPKFSGPLENTLAMYPFLKMTNLTQGKLIGTVFRFSYVFKQSRDYEKVSLFSFLLLVQIRETIRKRMFLNSVNGLRWLLVYATTSSRSTTTLQLRKMNNKKWWSEGKPPVHLAESINRGGGVKSQKLYHRSRISANVAK